jgi:Cu/Ag efflux pump CusA
MASLAVVVLGFVALGRLDRGLGGLLVSTFFTLVLIPTLYVIFEERWPRTLVDEAGEDVEPASDQPT